MKQKEYRDKQKRYYHNLLKDILLSRQVIDNDCVWKITFVMPPFEKEWAYCFSNVGPSVRLSVDQILSDHYLQNSYHTDSYFTCWLILVSTRPLLIMSSLGQRSWSQWSLVKKMYKWFPLILFRTIYHTTFILHMLIRLVKHMTRIDLWFTRSKVTRVTFVII